MKNKSININCLDSEEHFEDVLVKNICDAVFAILNNDESINGYDVMSNESKKRNIVDYWVPKNDMELSLTIELKYPCHSDTMDGKRVAHKSKITILTN